MSKTKIQVYSDREELVNWITHGLGIIFGAYALIFYLTFLGPDSNLTTVFSCLIYALSLIGLYLCSTLYHFAKVQKAKKILKKLDHIFIYFLIAGTYTPFLNIAIGGDYGLKLTFAIWAVALGGTAFKLFHIGKYQKLSLFIYLAMGWLSGIIWTPLTQALPPLGIDLLLYGGFFYTFGTIFYVMKKVPYHHMIWHLFVLAGSVCHFFAIKTILLK